MKLNELKPAAGAVKRRKRLGAGPGSGKGKTCGRGHKGQRSRGRTGLKPWFEGGQLPLARRLRKKGFNHTQRHPVEHVNVCDLADVPAGTEITPDVLREMGLIKGGSNSRVKLLAKGDLQVALTVRVHALSEAAHKKIVAAGGSVEELS